MSQETYFHDHWVTIEPERFAYYDALFQHPAAVLDRMLAPLGLTAGQVCLDLGCGPGHVAAAMARHVGPGGHVHGVDVNEPFLARAADVAAAAGVAGLCTFHHVTGEELPIVTGAVDRVVAKNVLEYVPDLGATLGEVARVLAPGGRLVAMDSDWGFVVVEPLAPEEVAELFRAAAPAFREPFIGRKLRAAFIDAGLADVQVTVVAATDTAGRTRGILENMINYGLTFGRLGPERATDLRTRLDAAMAAGTYLVVLPQFVVTGTKA